MAENMFMYWGSGSIPCWKPMIVLEEKGLSNYGNKLLSFSNKEHKGEDVLKLNPRGQTPTFKDGDVVVNESTAICDYLEYKYRNQGTKLLPDDAAQRAAVLQRTHEAQNNLQDKVMKDLVYTFFRTKPEDRNPTDIAEKREAVKKELQIWEEYLTKTGGFIAGKEFTMADVVFFPFVAFMFRLKLNRDSFPKITKYYDTVVERPSIKASWPPHWKDSEPDAKLTPFEGI